MFKAKRLTPCNSISMTWAHRYLGLETSDRIQTLLCEPALCYNYSVSSGLNLHALQSDRSVKLWLDDVCSRLWYC